MREHPYYTRLAIGAIKAYLLLHDQPELVHGPAAGGINGAEGDDAERKKALKKAKKEQQRLERIEAEKREAKKSPNVKSLDGEVKKEDPDPLGNELVQTKDPLNEATKFLTPLLKHGSKNIEAQCLGFEVYLRKGKRMRNLSMGIC